METIQTEGENVKELDVSITEATNVNKSSKIIKQNEIFGNESMHDVDIITSKLSSVSQRNFINNLSNILKGKYKRTRELFLKFITRNRSYIHSTFVKRFKHKKPHEDYIIFNITEIDKDVKVNEDSEWFRKQFDNKIGNLKSSTGIGSDVLKEVVKRAGKKPNKKALNYVQKVELKTTVTAVRWKNANLMKQCTCPVTKCICQGLKLLPGGDLRKASRPNQALINIQVTINELRNKYAENENAGSFVTQVAQPARTLVPRLINAVNYETAHYRSTGYPEVCLMKCDWFHEIPLDLNSADIIEENENYYDNDEDEETQDKIKTKQTKRDENKTDVTNKAEMKKDVIKKDEIKTGEEKTNEVETGEDKTGEVKTDDIKTDEVKTDKVKTDDVKTDEVKTDKVKTDETKEDNLPETNIDGTSMKESKDNNKSKDNIHKEEEKKSDVRNTVKQGNYKVRGNVNRKVESRVDNEIFTDFEHTVSTQSVIRPSGEVEIGQYSHVLYGSVKQTILRDIDGTQLHISTYKEDTSISGSDSTLDKILNLKPIKSSISKIKSLYSSIFDFKESSEEDIDCCEIKRKPIRTKSILKGRSEYSEIKKKTSPILEMESMPKQSSSEMQELKDENTLKTTDDRKLSLVMNSKIENAEIMQSSDAKNITEDKIDERIKFEKLVPTDSEQINPILNDKSEDEKAERVKIVSTSNDKTPDNNNFGDGSRKEGNKKSKDADKKLFSLHNIIPAVKYCGSNVETVAASHSGVFQLIDNSKN